VWIEVGVSTYYYYTTASRSVCVVKSNEMERREKGNKLEKWEKVPPYMSMSFVLKMWRS